MSDYIIRVENLGKKYKIRHQQDPQRYVALRDVIASGVKGLGSSVFSGVRSWVPGLESPTGNGNTPYLTPNPYTQYPPQFPTPNTQHPTPPTEDFWALRDVSFEVKQGEVLGIIGRNGAGKSTLLKILSRITKPTEGRVRIRGRVASLLEVGTGFHPELTGRENIFLNGADSRHDARARFSRKFDEIVAFAEVEKFLDTPVKRYSSGMYVRLAFAVAAHLEPEILIVDEVLAVGDAEFQKKCLGKMQRCRAREGRTVLFVSHNMTAVSSLCGSAVWLSEGALVARGSARELVHEYLSTVSSLTPSARLSRKHSGQDVRIDRVELLVNGLSTSQVCAGESCTIRVHYRLLSDVPLTSLSVAVELYLDGQQLTNLWTNSDANLKVVSGVLPKVGFLDCRMPKWPFRSHTIRVDVYCHTGMVTQDWIVEALVFDSHDGDFHGSGIITNPDQGIVFVDHSWAFGTADVKTMPSSASLLCASKQRS